MPDSGATSTIEQSYAGFSKHIVSVNGHSLVSDGCGDVDGLEVNIPNSIDDTPLENILRDEKKEVEHDIPTGNAV
jgi:hypothetical protein